ncbi:MAG: manganese efflux pump MntP family protein [Lachnospiraceae bacterium]|nr:manganese efflux pump MntP family protein [Ruminococcus sp.]MCM1277211.1 manganese efflux pump MntP family protein [Lachnospiraceae bacterium]
MEWDVMFIVNSTLLGVGLAMDAFSVSMANGLNDPKMKKPKMCAIAGVFAGFQFAMPIIGWICVRTIAQAFKAFESFIPWIALGLLGFIGGKMLFEGIKGGDTEDEIKSLGFGTLMVQGVATSIDALSVGFTIAEYDTLMAICSTLIIAAVTFVICIAGLLIGKKFGTKLSGKAQILGGVILICIGIEIFVKGLIQ